MTHRRYARILVRVVNDLETVVSTSIGDRASEWDALVSTMARPSPFLRSWWLDATVEDAARFVLVMRAGVLVGGLALQEDRWRGAPRLRLAGDGPLMPDHLDALASPGEEDHVVGALRQWLCQPGARTIDLAGVTSDSLVRQALPGPVRESEAAVAPWVRLPGTYAEYLAARPHGLRKTIRKTDRRLTAEGVRHRVVAREDVAGALEDLRRLHALQFGARSGFLPRFDAFRRAAIAGAAKGEVVLHELVTEDGPIAVEAFFLTDGVASFYQIGRDPDPQWDGSGILLKARAIEWFCEQGLTQIDLLRDDAPFKRRWAEDGRVMLRLEAAVGYRSRAIWVVTPLVRRVRVAKGNVSAWLRPHRRREAPTGPPVVDQP
jgi:CelD/BcsL family acetyltransferase involved in cellulose biosynthesis